MPPRRGKRAASERDAALPSVPLVPQRSLDEFSAWMRSQGITYDAARIRLSAGTGGDAAAWAAFAATDLAPGDLLCTIPKQAILSVRTTACADMIQAERLGGGLSLVVSVMYERSLGARSKWYGYLQSLPAREYLPIFWSQEELQLLQGTELELKAEADREATQSDFETDVEGLADKYGIERSCWTLDDFRAAASWVASRAFYVDQWHGNSLVPLADIFNHKAAVVELADEYTVAETADDDGDGHGEGEEAEEGEEGEESDEEEDEAEEQEAEEQEEQEAQKPKRAKTGDHAVDSGVDSHVKDACGPDCGHDHHHHHHQHGHHDPSQQGASKASRRHILPQSHDHAPGQAGPELRLEIGICSTERGGQEVLEIVAASPVAAGCEVHNTYGEHGNAELVNKYGFALDRNPFNEVSLDLQQVLESAQAAMEQSRQQQQAGARTASAASRTDTVRRELRRRLRIVSSQSSLLDPASEEPLLVMPGACISKPLLLLLHVLLAPDPRVQAWPSLEAALDEALTGLPGPAAAGAGRHGAPQAAPEAATTTTEEEAAGCGVSNPNAVSLTRLPSTTLSPAMKSALAAAVSARAARLPGSVKTTAAELKKTRACKSHEHTAALLAALTLRLTEQQALQEVLQALQLSRRME